MKADTDPNIFLSEINQLRNELSALDEVVPPERLTTIILDAFSAEKYSILKLKAIRDPDLSLEQIKRIMKTIVTIIRKGYQLTRRIKGQKVSKVEL